MKEMNITLRMEQCEWSDLTEEEMALVQRARENTKRSYAPYSEYHVGAAVKMGNGEIVDGSNQENVAYPSGTCAERTTLFYAHSQYPGVKMEMLAIAAFHKGDFVTVPVPPCGACRQVMVEFEVLQKSPMKILLCGRDVVYRIQRAADLLPLVFDF